MWARHTLFRGRCRSRGHLAREAPSLWGQVQSSSRADCRRYSRVDERWKIHRDRWGERLELGRYRETRRDPSCRMWTIGEKRRPLVVFERRKFSSPRLWFCSEEGAKQTAYLPFEQTSD